MDEVIVERRSVFGVADRTRHAVFSADERRDRHFITHRVRHRQVGDRVRYRQKQSANAERRPAVIHHDARVPVRGRSVR